MAPQKIYRRRDIEALTGKKRLALYAAIAEGTFPKPIKLGSGRAVGWLESDIAKWQAERIAVRDRS